MQIGTIIDFPLLRQFFLATNEISMWVLELKVMISPGI